MNKSLFQALAIFLLLAVPGEGASVTLSTVAEKLERTYGGFDDLEASFLQESRVAALGGRTRLKEGRIYFRRPGRMRWEYEKPEPQLIVADGANLWYYRPRQNQVIVRELDAAFTSQTPLLFLFGKGRLAEEFIWTDGEAEVDADGRYVLELTPKVEAPDLVALRLEVRPGTFTVAATVLRDAFGNETRLEFYGEQVNGDLGDELFLFEPPPEAEVIAP